jgi:hypothetical protein
MKKLINIELLKKDPQRFFSKLPGEAEEEINKLLEYILYKYNLNDTFNDKDNETSRFEFFEKNPIKVDQI